MQRAKLERKSNVLYVGDLGKGACRHRALLFKFLADQVRAGFSALNRARTRTHTHTHPKHTHLLPPHAHRWASSASCRGAGT